jgi:iron(III) transport system permease protein
MKLRKLAASPALQIGTPLLAGGVVALVACGERVRGILFNTLQLASAATAIALPLGVLVALLLVKTTLPGRGGMLALWRAMIFVPLFVHVAGWQAGFGVDGWFRWSSTPGYSNPLIDGWWGAIWIHAMAAVPWVVCIVAAGLGSTPSSPEEAASLVVPPGRVLWLVTLPAAAPSVAIAAAWVFTLTASEMTVTDFFQIRTFAEEIYTQESMGGAPIDNPGAEVAPWPWWPKSIGVVAGTLVLAAMATGVLASLYRWLRHAGRVVDYRQWQAPLRGSMAWLASLAAGLALVLTAGLPLAGLVYKAGLGSRLTPSGYVREWSTQKLGTELAGAIPHYHRELGQSLGVGVAVASVCVLVAVAIGWHLRHARRLPLGWLTLFALILAVPGPLLGLLVIRLMNQPADSWLAGLTVLYDDTLTPWIVVQSIRYFGIASLIVFAGMSRVPQPLLDAAKVDGVGAVGRLFRVALPLAWPAVGAAWFVTFALSIAELSASVVVAPPMAPTLSIQIFQHLHQGAEARVAAICLVLLAMVAVAATLGMWFGNKWFRRFGE